MTDTPLDRVRENPSGFVAVLHSGLWLALLFLGFEWWLPVMLFGYVAVVPLASMLFEDEEENAESTAEEGVAATHGRQGPGDRSNALETLRDRYARGELTEEQFERKVERLLATETLEDVEDRHADREPLTERE